MQKLGKILSIYFKSHTFLKNKHDHPGIFLVTAKRKSLMSSRHISSFIEICLFIVPISLTINVIIISNEIYI